MKKKIKKTREKASGTKNTEESQLGHVPKEVKSLIPPNLVVLGMDEENRTILWVKDSRRLWVIPKLREIDGCLLIQMAGQHCLQDSEVELSELKAAIAQASREHCFGPEDRLGQGVWKLPGEPGCLILSGDRAMILECGMKGVSTRPVEVPVIRKKLLEFNAADKWIDLDWLKAYVRGITPAKTKALWKRLTDYLSCWLPAVDSDYEVIAGMVIATSIQGMLSFRPHVWVTGATNTGKTALFTFLGRLWPYALKFESETSEAAIRQEIQRSCLPVLFDECEGWHGRRSVIKLLRSSTRGGKIIKGTPSHKPIRFGLHHIFWLASIDTGLRKDVDRNRFIIIELRRSDSIVIPEPAELAAFGRELVAAALFLAERIRFLHEAAVNTTFSKPWGRFAELLALPASVRTAFLHLSEQDNAETLRKFLDDRKELLAELSEPDHIAVLSAICSATIMARVPEPQQDLGDLTKLDNSSPAD